MNEREMSDLLTGATQELAPDVQALVAGGLHRGRVRQRRRRAAAVVATAAAVAAVAGWPLLGAGGDGSRTVGPADPVPPAASPRATDSPGPAPSIPDGSGATGTVGLAITTAQVPTTFASLEPGEVSAPSARSGPDAAPVVDFTWNGFGIRVGLTPDDYATGRSVPDPARRCADDGDGDPCRPGPGGTVVSTSSFTNPAIDGGTAVRSVQVFRPDGWDVLVMAYNGPGKEGPVTADDPPFTLPELRRIASSDAWFR